ncbi:MAG TPA: Gfo/Idh/MocA family oxidoreductase [Gemmatimonadales bacterium]|nr:Gfo/Idh/MocA family oxidoreductase [Gemmatimonadales bacterium]
MRVGFIGAGNMAGHHLQALQRVQTPHEVVGVQDSRSATAAAFAERAGTSAFATIVELLERARPDIVHICTPAGAHFEPARQALLAGAHIYVEKPFVETPQEADTLCALAAERDLLICAGHQLLRNPAFRQLLRTAGDLQPVTLVDSSYAFRPPQLDPYKAPAGALGRQLLDILPHPLYVLVAALESDGRNGQNGKNGRDGGGGQETPRIEIVHATATPTDLHALLRAGAITGRLTVSLRARPVAATLTMAGAKGSLSVDFDRGILLGAGNEGTSPVEKIVNPLIESGQLAWRSTTSLLHRLTGGANYPGLVELLRAFYAAVAAGDRSPIAADHLRHVTAVYEQLAATVRSAVAPVSARVVAKPTPTTASAPLAPLAVLTGASGFFGRAISRELTRRGFRVRGIGRSEQPSDPNLQEWIRTDLANDVPRDALAGAAVVVHAAAETSGGFDAHERNTLGTTRHLLRAMASAGVRRLVHISSLSVLRPPRPFWERQAEQTPLADEAERLGPYTWGKREAERLVAEAAERGEIEARIIRPAALIDWTDLHMPGLLGRRLFGQWHLGLGRSSLPFAVCDVATAAAAVAWCAERFSEAPPVVNLIDPTITTRGDLLARFRAHGWRGRMVWTPIGLLAGGVMAAGFVLGLARHERARRLKVWSILRPRRYDVAVSSSLLAAVREE